MQAVVVSGPARCRGSRGDGGARSRRWRAVHSSRRCRPRSRTPTPRTGRARVAVVDYGVKRSVLRRLAAAGAAVRGLSARRRRGRARGLRRRAALAGPGRPGAAAASAEIVRDLLGRTSVLGICLGHQVLAMATGHETFKLPFGHRGANHPVLQRADGRVLVTSQNHGFAVRATDAKEATHVSLYDETVEGPRLPRPARAVAAVPPGGRPRPARCVASDRALGRRDRGLADAEAHRHPHDLPHRLRPDRDRPGRGVRLRRLPGAEGAARGRLPHDRGQLEPGDDHDRPGIRRPHVSRAARPRRRLRRPAPRAARRAAPDAGRPDRAQPRAGARGVGDPRRARHRADRSEARRDQPRRGQAALQGRCRIVQPARSDVDHRHRHRTDRGCRDAGGRPARIHARRSRRRVREHGATSCARRSRSGCARARSDRCSSRSRCAAGTSSSSRSCATASTTS